MACVKKNKFAPVTVNVVDKAGDVLVTKRMEGCSSKGIPEFSYAKAYTCIAMKCSSREFRDKYTSDASSPAKFCQMTSMVTITGGKMAPFPGGVLMLDGSDDNGSSVLGAVGVSGAAGDEDEYAALTGIIQSGLNIQTLPKNHSCKTIKDD